MTAAERAMQKCSSPAGVGEQEARSEASPQQSKRRRLPNGAVSDELRTVSSLVDRFMFTPDAKSMIFVMVGLPARGKSFVSMRLVRFLQWTGTEARVFNVGKHRRNTEIGVQDAAYFDPASAAAVQRRDQLAFEVCDELLSWVSEREGRAAVFDATNTTKARRAAVADRLGNTGDFGVVFVESLCDDEEVIEANIQQKLAKSPDYSALDKAAARKDLLQRVKNYEIVYEPLQEETVMVKGKPTNISYIKLVNFASHVVAHNVYGRAATQVLPYLMALHVGSCPVWLVRLPHATQSAGAWRNANAGAWPPPSTVHFSEQPLSAGGARFADTLVDFVQQQSKGAAVFCCTHRRSIEVGDRLGGGRVRVALNPQDRGSGNGLSTAEVAAQHPEVWADPVEKRFPGGESLGDLLLRLMPTLIEIEQEMRPTLVVAPLSVLQVLYCYFVQRPVAEALTVKLPMHTLIEMKSDGAHFIERRLSEAELRQISGKSGC